MKGKDSEDGDERIDKKNSGSGDGSHFDNRDVRPRHGRGNGQPGATGKYSRRRSR